MIFTRPLNEGREINPGDTPLCVRHAVARLVRSTKAGRLTPATRRSAAPRSSRRRPLNEGREINPGDTGDTLVTDAMLARAQRRPGD